jgi:hypothetical protein
MYRIPASFISANIRRFDRMADNEDVYVILRRRWNDTHAARAPLSALRELVMKNDPGGVCSLIPRPFPYARIWCDQLIDGRAIHLCNPATAPHELQLCVIETDNSPELNARVRSMLRRLTQS